MENLQSLPLLPALIPSLNQSTIKRFSPILIVELSIIKAFHGNYHLKIFIAYTPVARPSIILRSGLAGGGLVVTTCGAGVGLKEAILVTTRLAEAEVDILRIAADVSIVVEGCFTVELVGRIREDVWIGDVGTVEFLGGDEEELR